MSFDLKITDGDLVISNSGDLKKVENNDKLVQDILKIAITPIGGNPFFPWYGSYISKNLIGNSLNFEMISTFANSHLRSSLETLQKLQKAQANSGQRVTAGELLAAIQETKIERNQVDPRFFRITIKALTKALNSVSTSFDAGL